MLILKLINFKCFYACKLDIHNTIRYMNSILNTIILSVLLSINYHKLM